jgi:phosphoenolpyruvate carboxykinase (ATP)
MFRPPTKRFFTTLTKECQVFMHKLGITHSEIVYNPTVGQLYEYAMQPEHMHSVDPTVMPSAICDTGALSCSSGKRMGRSPKDKRIVLDQETKENVFWGKVNIPISEEAFTFNRQRALDFLRMQ